MNMVSQSTAACLLVLSCFALVISDSRASRAIDCPTDKRRVTVSSIALSADRNARGMPVPQPVIKRAFPYAGTLRRRAEVLSDNSAAIAFCCLTVTPFSELFGTSSVTYSFCFSVIYSPCLVGFMPSHSPRHDGVLLLKSVTIVRR